MGKAVEKISCGAVVKSADYIEEAKYQIERAMMRKIKPHILWEINRIDGGEIEIFGTINLKIESEGKNNE